MRGLRIQKHPAIRERIYQYLKHRILKGDIPPGQRLVESQLASQVGTSRTPIREALHNLEFEKLIKAIPKVGYIVCDITESDIREICEIRVVLESLAIRWALENKDSELVLKLKSNLDQMKDYINKDKLKKIPELDSEFHDLICQASGSTWLTDLNQYLREYMLRLRVKCLTKRKLATRALQGHRAILRALEIQDAKSAEDAIRYHMDITMEDIISQSFRSGSKENRPALLTSIGKVRKGT